MKEFADMSNNDVKQIARVTKHVVNRTHFFLKPLPDCRTLNGPKTSIPHFANGGDDVTRADGNSAILCGIGNLSRR